MNDLFEMAPCGILEFQENGAITSVNRHFCDLVGYAREELTALKFDDVLTMSSRIFHQTHFLPLLRLQDRAEEIYFTLRHKNEDPVPVLTNASHRAIENSSRIVCAFMHVPQRRRYEEEILLAKKRAEDALNSNEELRSSRAQLERHLQELDANLAALERRNLQMLRFNQLVSHDLREPARKITTFTSIIREENRASLTESAESSLQRIDAAGARIHELLQALQEFLAVDHPADDLCSVDLNAIVSAAQRGLVKQIEVIYDTLPTVHGSPEQLTTLFSDLFRSAIQRPAGAPPKVRITSIIIQQNSYRKIAGKYRYVDFAQITVTDNGRGFQTGNSKSVFELLRKVHGGNADVSLAVCQRIAENHDGSITVRSMPGESPTFTILLPVHPLFGSKDMPANSLSEPAIQ